jgi:hypothetical protein
MPHRPQSLFIGPAPSEARPANLFMLLLILLYVEVKLSVRAAAHREKRDKKIKPFPQPRRAGVLGALTTSLPSQLVAQ